MLVETWKYLLRHWGSSCMIASLFCGCCKHGHPASSVNKLDQSCETTGFSAFCNGFVHIICDAEADFIFVLQLKKFCLNFVFIGCFIFLLLFTCLNFFLLLSSLAKTRRRESRLLQGILFEIDVEAPNCWI